MNKIYHGSKVQDLKTIKPKESTQTGSYVYGTLSYELALIFSYRPGSLLCQISVEDEKFTLCERKEGILKKYYENKVSIYEMDSNNFEYFKDFSFSNHELRAEGEQQVLFENKIDNAYNELLKLNEDNKIKIYEYPNRPDNIPEDDSDLIHIAFMLYHMGGNKLERLESFNKEYPKFTNLTDNILNKLEKLDLNEQRNFIDNIYDYKNKKLNEELIYKETVIKK